MRAGSAALAGLLLAGGAAQAQGQDADRLLDSCRMTAPVQTQPSCTDLVTAATALQGTLARAGTWGGVLPGPAHTFGKRFPEGPPRFVASARAGFVTFQLPGGGDGVSRVRPALQATLGGGVFEGFRVRPAVGGVLALDLFGSAGWVSLPEEFEDGGVHGGVGVRLGLLRESFDVPALAFLVSQHWAGTARGSAGAPAASWEVTPRTTAVRLALAKDVGGLGVGGVVGRDWSRGSARIVPADTERDAVEVDRLATARWVVAGSVTLNYVIFFLEGEIGWMGTTEAVEPDAFRPGGQVFASLSARLVL